MGLIDFKVERERHVRFVARDDVMARLDEWLLDAKDTRWVFVTGGPGMGKSAILAAWLARHEAADSATRGPAGPIATTLVPHHFIRRQVADWDQPEAIAASLAAQIEAAFPALRDVDARPQSRLLDLLGRVSKQIDATRPLVVIVDGLDETRADSGDNPLPRFLPHVVPRGIRFLCATRATYPHLRWLELRTPVRSLDLDSPQWAASNEAVVRAFWQAVAVDYMPPLPATMVDTAIARSDGNVLYAVMLHDTLRDLPPDQRQADRIPRGLEALICELWDRASQPEVRAGVSVLCAAQEAISLDVLGKLVERPGIPRWTHDNQQRFVHDARQLLLEERASWNGVDAYRLRHDWVRDVIAAKLGEETIRIQHGKLARGLATWPPPVGASERRYALRHAMTHRLQAGDPTSAWGIVVDVQFLEAKCRELSVDDTEADVTRLAARCRASGDDALGQRADDVARALARESHWLRIAPEATAGILWNRLRRSGWHAHDLDRQLRIPVGTRFLRVRHALKRESPALVRDFVGHSDSVTACTVTPDGRRVISASSNGILKAWNAQTGQELATLEQHSGGVNACAVTPDCSRVISASDDGTLKAWDLESQTSPVTFEGHTDSVTACAITPDGLRVVSASLDGTLKVWDIQTGCALVTLRGHTGWVTACAVMPDGLRVISVSVDQTLRVWDLSTGRVLSTMQGDPYMLACAITPDGRRVISASVTETLKVWNVETGQMLAILEGHSEQVTACVVTPDGRRVVSASRDQTLKVWDLESGRVLLTLEGHAADVTACAVTPDGTHVISASQDEMLKLWYLERESDLTIPGERLGCLTACAVTADGRLAIAASIGWSLGVWDVESGQELYTLEGQTRLVETCMLTLDGHHVASVLRDKTLKIWDLTSGRELTTPEGYVHAVLSCAATASGWHAVSASDEGTLKVWDLVSGREITTLEDDTDEVLACAITADGRRLVSTSGNDSLRVWDLESGRMLATLEGHTGRVHACVVTPNCRHVISASQDRTLKVWDIQTGTALASLEGHTNEVTACAILDDCHLISASHDRTLRIWNLRTYTCVGVHHGDAPYMAVAASATAVIAADQAGTLWFLDCSSFYSSTALPHANQNKNGQGEP